MSPLMNFDIDNTHVMRFFIAQCARVVYTVPRIKINKIVSNT